MEAQPKQVADVAVHVPPGTGLRTCTHKCKLVVRITAPAAVCGFRRGIGLPGAARCGQCSLKSYGIGLPQRGADKLGGAICRPRTLRGVRQASVNIAEGNALLTSNDMRLN